MSTFLGSGFSKFFSRSDETAPMAKMALEVGIVSALLKWGTTDSTTPEQRAEAQVQQDQQKAAAMLEDAQQKEAQAEEDRRRAYFANQGPSF